MPNPSEAERERVAAASAARRAQYDAAMAEYHASDPQGRVYAISQCGLCDDDGYRGSAVCDHQDHTADYAGPGRAAVQAELEKIRQRQGGAA